MPYIIGFNGPPKCGKDSVAQLLRQMLDESHTIPTHLDHLARPMRQVAMTMWNEDANDFQLYTEIKDQCSTVYGVSLREFMIEFSEQFVKPRFGQGFWGKKLLLDHPWITQGLPGILLVPDIGFYDEVKVFDDSIGKDNVLIVQMERPGIGWANDSRSYCSHLSKVMSLTNGGSVMDAAYAVFDCITRLGWTLD